MVWIKERLSVSKHLNYWCVRTTDCHRFVPMTCDGSKLSTAEDCCRCIQMQGCFNNLIALWCLPCWILHCWRRTRVFTLPQKNHTRQLGRSCNTELWSPQWRFTAVWQSASGLLSTSSCWSRCSLLFCIFLHLPKAFCFLEWILQQFQYISHLERKQCSYENLESKGKMR